MDNREDKKSNLGVAIFLLKSFKNTAVYLLFYTMFTLGYVNTIGDIQFVSVDFQLQVFALISVLNAYGIHLAFTLENRVYTAKNQKSLDDEDDAYFNDLNF